MYGFMMPNNIIGRNVTDLTPMDFIIFIGYMIFCIIIFIGLYKGTCYIRDKSKNFQIKNNTLKTLSLIATSITIFSYLQIENKTKIDFNKIITSENFKNAILIFVGTFIFISIVSYIIKRKIKLLNVFIYGIIFITIYSLYQPQTIEKKNEIKPNITMKKIEEKRTIEVKKEEPKNLSNNQNIKIQMH